MVMVTKLSDLIKEGKDIKNGIYADNGGGFYATYLFSDHNKYIKWAINSIRFIENNFPKDDNYIKFKDIIAVIDENVTPIEFNKLLFILEYYNTAIEEKANGGIDNNGIDIVLDSIKEVVDEDIFKSLETILENKDKKDKKEAKELIVEKLNALSNNALSEILANILLNLKK